MAQRRGVGQGRRRARRAVSEGRLDRAVGPASHQQLREGRAEESRHRDLGWCASKGWAQESLLGGIEVLGERKRGKPQFVGKDESRKFLAKALELGAVGDAGAIAGATALLLGMRASEIADRTVRELDDDGKVLVITSAKTRAGIRRLEVPEVLRPLLAGLAKDKAPTDKIFGPKAGRYWVLRAVNRVCKLALVPIITAHGLRGTHASLAVGAGMSGPAVAASLGHENFGVTTRHYATAEAVAGAAASRFQTAITERGSSRWCTLPLAKC